MRDTDRNLVGFLVTAVLMVVLLVTSVGLSNAYRQRVHAEQTGVGAAVAEPAGAHTVAHAE